MFSKLKVASVNHHQHQSPHQSTGQYTGGLNNLNPVCSSLDLNPISQYFELGKQVGSAGPELAWKIFDSIRKSDRKVRKSQSLSVLQCGLEVYS